MNDPPGAPWWMVHDETAIARSELQVEAVAVLKKRRAGLTSGTVKRAMGFQMADFGHTVRVEVSFCDVRSCLCSASCSFSPYASLISSLTSGKKTVRHLTTSHAEAYRSPTHNREPYDTLLYCPTSCSYRSVCGSDAACRLQF